MKKVVDFIRSMYETEDFIALHEPKFIGNEKKYLIECIDSTYVSSVGKFVDVFENEFAKTVGSKYAIATVNGTSALHVALMLAGVNRNDEVITQPLTFVATNNAISYCGAKPVFVDVDLDTMGMSPESIDTFLKNNCEIVNNVCINKITKRVVKACLPMHTFGHPCRIDVIRDICNYWNIALVEDAAESLGSYYNKKHTGTFGLLGVFSFNGNKIITSGGGGVIVTDDDILAKKAKHITTTSKIFHGWEFIHDEIGFNYRLPNINAALLVAQLEQLDKFLKNKRDLAKKYKKFFDENNIKFISEPPNSMSNYWLNAICLKDKKERDDFLEYTNSMSVSTRPIWRLNNKLKIYDSIELVSLSNANWLEDRIVNIPSSVRLSSV